MADYVERSNRGYEKVLVEIKARRLDLYIYILRTNALTHAKNASIRDWRRADIGPFWVTVLPYMQYHGLRHLAEETCEGHVTCLEITCAVIRRRCLR